MKLIFLEKNLKTKIKNSFNSLRQKYDFIIVDCAPVFNVLNDVILEITDELIVPIKLDKLSTAGITRLIEKTEGQITQIILIYIEIQKFHVNITKIYHFSLIILVLF